MSAEKSIPARPSLEQYRKQAKDLVKERARLRPEAFERIRRHHPRLSELSEAQLRTAAFTLSDAQLVLAREHAFKTWPEFMRHVAAGQPQPHALAPPPERYVARIDAEGVSLEAEIAGWQGASALVLLIQVAGSRGRASTRAMANELLQGYLGRSPRPAETARLRLMRQMVRLYYAGLLLSPAVNPAAPMHSLAAPSQEEFRASIARGDTSPVSRDTMAVIGKMCLAGFMAECAAPGYEESMARASEDA